jgi:predicted metal-dependent hydrolase
MKTQISYALVRSARKTTAITVSPDQRVTVRAPQQADADAIERIVQRRSAWIVRQQKFFEQFLPKTPPRAFVSGETHLYLGRKYRLKVSLAEREEVKLRGAYLYICTRTPADPEQVRKALYGWYTAHAKEKFAERLVVCLDSPLGSGMDVPELRIRQMAKRWGSCHASGTLILNLDLIRAPRACIDYVIMHELCHRRYPNHSPQFYTLLTRLLPDWLATKLRLEQILA